MLIDSVFVEVAALLALSALLGGVALVLKQPLIVAFVAVGILAGPAWLRLIEADESVELLASMGISLLLFVVGLRLDLQVIRSTGAVALITGIGQMASVVLVGFGLSRLLGFSQVHASYIAIALAFSSTIIVVKLLSDQREIDALHGRLAVGILIVQDIAVIVVMIGLATLSEPTGRGGYAVEALLVLGKVALVIVMIGLLMRFIVEPTVQLLARSQELLVLAAVAWAFVLAAAGEGLGLSQEVGAFLAGVSLASTPIRDALGARLASLRDFLLLFFFLSLGASLNFTAMGAHLGAALLLSIFVLVAKPVVISALLGAFGYRRRVGFLTGISLAQISEFSLILGALGVRLGHLDAETLGIITLVGLITITVSSYLIPNSTALYDRLAPVLTRFPQEPPRRVREADEPDMQTWDCIVFGLGRYGGAVARHLEGLSLRVLGVDFDPEALAAWRRQGGTARYGDGEDAEFASTLPLATSRCVVSTVPHRQTNLALLEVLRRHGYTGVIALTARQDGDEQALEEAGATVILRPFFDAAENAAQRVAEIVRTEV